MVYVCKDVEKVLPKTLSVQKDESDQFEGRGRLLQTEIAENWQNQGYRWLNLLTIQRGYFVSQDTI